MDLIRQMKKKMLKNYLAYGTDSYDSDYDQSIISVDLDGSKRLNYNYRNLKNE